VRLAQRLLLGSLLVISVLVVFIVLTSDRRLDDRLIAQAQGQLARETRVVAASWQPGVDSDSLADVWSEALDHRVTLIDSTGRIVGDSDFEPPALGLLGDQRGRPEVAAILAAPRAGAPSIGILTESNEAYAITGARGGAVRVSISLRRLDVITRGARQDVLVAGLIAMVIAGGLAYLFSREVSRPIVDLRDVARALAAGDLSRRPQLTAPGEVGDLATALHRMADQLAARLTALETEDALMAALIEALNEGVVAVDRSRRIVRINGSGRRLLGLRGAIPIPADHLPRERALREALDEALGGGTPSAMEIRVDERTLALTARPLSSGGAVLALFDLTPMRRLETVRRDFVANVSHELKTPLTVIGGFAETLADDDMPADQRKRFAETIQMHARRMQRIVDDLLDLSRIESGGWRPNPSVVDLASVASDAVSVVRDTATAKRIAIQIAPAADAPTAFADPTALRQILTNLVENAVRYTPGGGTVTVFSEPAAGGVRIGVRDTGIGIAPEHLARIFERFYRVDPARSRDAGGTGLGLSIVRHLVEAHGGRVRAESAIGRGTTITAFFPQASAPPL
jgi:two-component system, OmpR family, phosphate regulon sensor histidine kinase PhoR